MPPGGSDVLGQILNCSELLWSLGGNCLARKAGRTPKLPSLSDDGSPRSCMVAPARVLLSTSARSEGLCSISVASRAVVHMQTSAHDRCRRQRGEWLTTGCRVADLNRCQPPIAIKSCGANSRFP